MKKKEYKPMEVKVKLRIRDVKIELSIDEVRELGKILESIIGKESPNYIPYYVEPHGWKYWNTEPFDPTTTWTSSGSYEYDETSTDISDLISNYSVSLKT